MNIGIIGARRTSNGIGEFIAKYFHAAGAQVNAVLGTTEQSSRVAADNLKKYGIMAHPYIDFSRMMNEEDLDAVVIASPTPTHEYYIEQCIEAGAHVFCEKPFVSPDTASPARLLRRIFTRARRKRITIAMNSQWGFCLHAYEELCGTLGKGSAKTFQMRLSPICTGRAMIPDSVPHALSILYTALGDGMLQDVRIEGTRESMQVSFAYKWVHGTCKASVSLVTEQTQPRTLSFGFDGQDVHRAINMDTYTISFLHEGNSLVLTDPLDLSVRDFMEAIEDHRPPTIGEAHIISTSKMLKDIYDACTIR
ncbi:MAG TPA: Gfo/Idh/MocA family oxidoreductase [Deltaproteobacteria bacterium]|nr:Gfo/Idh/MocA family oxidoreductase [Deltaproteobacteria bacterium]